MALRRRTGVHIEGILEISQLTAVTMPSSRQPGKPWHRHLMNASQR
jgi:hypothetical protein